MLYYVVTTLALGAAMWYWINRSRATTATSQRHQREPSMSSSSAAASKIVRASLPPSTPAIAMVSVDSLAGVDRSHCSPSQLFAEFQIDLRDSAPITSLFRRLHAKYGPVAKFYMHDLPVISIEEPETLKSLVGNSELSSRHQEPFAESPFGPTCLRNFAQPKQAQVERRRITHTLCSPQTLAAKLAEFVSLANDAIGALSPSSVLVSDIVRPFAFRATARVVLGLNPGERLDRLRQVYDDILAKGLLAPNGSFVPGAEDAAGAEVILLREMLLQQYREPNAESDNWLYMLQHSEDPETSLPFTEEQVVRSLNVLMVGAYSPLVSTLSWSVLMIAEHDDAQQRIGKELSHVLKVTIDSLKTLHYLVLVVKEAMRLYPPFSFITRVACNDTAVGKYRVPAGSTVALPVMRLHTNEQWFPNADQFNPNNFAEDRAAKRHPASYCPFGFGARSCPGERLAWLEIKVFLAVLLKRFHLARSSDGTEASVLTPTESDVLLPEANAQVRLEAVPSSDR